jgi:hypothetical protein
MKMELADLDFANITVIEDWFRYAELKSFE